jgi:TPR repeat protein
LRPETALPADAPTAFFSYSREDSEFAIRLAEDLKAAGAVVWIDQLDIEPGQEWDSAIEDAVTQSPRMLLILSVTSVKSKKVRNEIAFALDEGKTIIPVLYQDCMVPLQLRRIQNIDFRADYARGLKALLKVLGVEQQMAASVAAAPAVSKGSATIVSVGEEQRHAEAHALLEQASEKARLELEQERRQVAEQDEKRQLAEETARLEQERERLATAEKARQEQEERARLAAEKTRVEQERERLERERVVAPVPAPSRAIVSPTLKRIALAACGILVAALILYWATRPKQEEVKTQTPEVLAQPSSPPSATEVHPDTTAAGKAAADKTATDKAAADKLAADKAAADKAAARRAAADKAAADKAAAGKQQATESLSAQAMNKKGDDYYYGRGVSKDDKQAASWYRKAAEAGSGEGMYNLGWMYRYGKGVDQDNQQAVSWYRKAAEAGIAAGMNDLGLMYANGYGVDKGYNQAVTW